MSQPDNSKHETVAAESQSWVRREVKYPLMPKPGDGRGADFSKLKPHRCHPRLADVAHTFVHLQLADMPHRVGLLLQCYRSEVGAEPTEPFLLPPEDQLPRFKAAKPSSTDAATSSGGTHTGSTSAPGGTGSR